MTSNKALQEVFLKSLPDPAFVVDSELRLVAWNDSLAEIFSEGSIRDKLLSDGQFIDRWVGYGYPAHVLEGMYDLLARGSDTCIHEFSISSGTTQRWFEQHARLWSDDEGKILITAVLRDISMYLNSREIIRRSEEKYRGIIQNSSLGLLEVDNDEIILFANKAFCDITGFSPQDLIGQKADELLLPQDDVHAMERMEHVRDQRSSGVANAYEIQIMRKDGNLVWVLISGAPIYDHEGRITGSIGIHHDISGQKKESELRNSLLKELDQRNMVLQRQQEHLTLINRFASGLLAKGTVPEVYRHISDSIRGQMGFIDCIIYNVNHEANRIEHDPAFMLDIEPGAPGFRPLITVPLGAGITGSAALHGRIEWVTDTALDGRYIQDKAIRYDAEGKLEIDVSGRSLRRSELAVPIIYGDTVLGVIDTGHPDVGFFDALHRDTLATLADLAAIKIRQIHSSLSLKDSEQRVRAIIDSSLDAVMTIGADGCIAEATEQASAMFGVAVQDLNGMHFNQLLEEEYRFPDSFFRRWAGDRSAPAPATQRVEVGIRKAGGEVIQAELSLARVKIQGELLVSVFVRDITVRKQAEIELRSALAREAELNSLKTRFITMTSHEFRTPLTTIQSTAELLFMTLEGIPGLPEEKLQKYVRRITNEVDRLTHLMNDILVIGRVESGKISFQPVPTDIVSFLRDLLDGKAFIRGDQRAVDVLVAGKERDVPVDQQLLTHILTNLVSNALKYSAGRPSPEVVLDYLEDRVRIAVRDFGIGIPERDLESIFDSFYRGSNAENIQGTGLGLVIVKQFVDLHNGTITVTSRLNEGSVFTVELFYMLSK